MALVKAAAPSGSSGAVLKAAGGDGVGDLESDTSRQSDVAGPVAAVQSAKAAAAGSAPGAPAPLPAASSNGSGSGPTAAPASADGEGGSSAAAKKRKKKKAKGAGSGGNGGGGDEVAEQAVAGPADEGTPGPGDDDTFEDARSEPADDTAGDQDAAAAGSNSSGGGGGGEAAAPASPASPGGRFDPSRWEAYVAGPRAAEVSVGPLGDAHTTSGSAAAGPAVRSTLSKHVVKGEDKWVQAPANTWTQEGSGAGVAFSAFGVFDGAGAREDGGRLGGRLLWAPGGVGQPCGRQRQLLAA